jgi:DNA gyrase subunit A
MPENIIQTEFSAEMQQSYINYSMSVITSRAVPDVRDGLKPVQRRVLYAMSELGLNADKPHRKSARIVGDTMGKYHPHGDSSIYETLVVLSQDFKKGMALVDGHGNFGSIEGDGAAAMRYTEARLKKFTQEVYLADLDKNVVDFVPNFDETEKEPSVLPVRIPNVLVNGSDGIAVGMTTSIPTHNLSEVVDGMKYLMDYPDATCAELMQFIKGPDFPTGGIVTNKDELLSIYETGKGKIKLRGKAEIVRGSKRGEKDSIVITQIPYTMIGANIGKFLSDVMELAESKKLPDITDISNQSKDEIRIVIELKKGADAEKILQGLYKKTKLEDSFGVNMLVIADGKPRVLGLKEILEKNIRFQVEINTRKYTTLLEKEKSRLEIQEGLIAAVDIIDLIIEIIRGSKDLRMAKGCLTAGKTEGIQFKSKASEKQAKTLSFTEAQATAILELRLSKLIGLEILALQKEHQETLERIAQYEEILKDPKVMMKTIKKDLDRIKKNYGVPRVTTIENQAAAVFEEAPVKAAPVVFAMNRFGYVKTIDTSVYAKNEEAVLSDNRVVFTCMNDARVAVFTREGTLHQVKMADLPLCKPKDKGVPLDNISNYDSAKENILTVLPMNQVEEQTLIFLTENGMGKRVAGNEFVSTKKTIASTKLAEGDALAAVLLQTGDHVALLTDGRTGLRFGAEELPLQKKTAVGVRTVKLAAGQHVKNAYVLDSGEELIVELDGARISISALKCKKRDAKPEKLRVV